MLCSRPTAKLPEQSDTRFLAGALTRSIDDGQPEKDKNTAERSLRLVVMGRKIDLFFGV